MRLISFLIVLMMFGNCGAINLQDACRVLTVSEEQVEIKVEKSALAVIHNVGDAKVWITHPVDHSGADAGWSSELAAGKWSALFVSPSDKPFALACVESRPGHERYISCAGAIQVCMMPTARIPKEASGNFWAVESVSKKDLVPQLQQRGFEWPVAKD